MPKTTPRTYSARHANALYMKQLRSIAYAMNIIAHTPDADIDLIAECAALREVAKRFNALPRSQRPGSKAAASLAAKEDAIVGEEGDLVERIAAIQAQTMEGIRAKARALVAWEPSYLNSSQPPRSDEQIIASILRDLVAT